MSRNIRLQIAYDGTAYSGWQRQSNAPTIQGTLEKALRVMTCSEVTLHGAGRTDAGVHARAMIANFTTMSAIPGPGFMAGLNSMLAPDIRIIAVDEVDDHFHSRYSATGKVYCYALFTGFVQPPTERLYSAHCPQTLGLENMRSALACLEGTRDFSSFEGSGSRDISITDGRGAVRTLYRTRCNPDPDKPQTLLFHFYGDGFLRHMVRNIVGTVIDVGRGRITPADFSAILQARDRSLAGPTAPARGLMLEKVLYSSLPESDL